MTYATFRMPRSEMPVVVPFPPAKLEAAARGYFGLHAFCFRSTFFAVSSLFLSSSGPIGFAFVPSLVRCKCLGVGKAPFALEAWKTHAALRDFGVLVNDMAEEVSVLASHHRAHRNRAPPVGLVRQVGLKSTGCRLIRSWLR